MIKRPMLASSENVTINDLPSLSYPIYATPKLDGIRMLTVPYITGVPLVKGVSRKFIKIPNLMIQQWCEDCAPAGLDGEIIIPGASFNDIQSFVMSEVTLPKAWEYHVFDYHANLTQDHLVGYLQRLQKLQTIIEHFKPSRVKILRPWKFHSPENLATFYKNEIKAGVEGLILRSGDGPYKEGRSTRNEGFMLKMKSFLEAEAIIIGFEPSYANQNSLTKDNTGQAKRSSHQANRVPRDTLGKYVVRDSKGRKFCVAAASSDDFNLEVWNNRSRYMGLTLTYSHQPFGSKPGGLPRMPIFKGIRYD